MIIIGSFYYIGKSRVISTVRRRSNNMWELDDKYVYPRLSMSSQTYLYKVANKHQKTIALYIVLGNTSQMVEYKYIRNNCFIS